MCVLINSIISVVKYSFITIGLLGFGIWQETTFVVCMWKKTRLLLQNMMEQNIISAQRHVKRPLTGTLRNMTVWPRNFLINIDNIVVGGSASFLIKFRIDSLTMYMKRLIYPIIRFEQK